MTMVEVAMTTMAAGKFKAQCLAVIDDVETKRISVIVTKHGRPVAKMVPLDLPEEAHPLDAFRFPGKIEIIGDIEGPLYTDEELAEFELRTLDQLK